MKNVHFTTVQARISIFFTFSVLYFKLTLGTKTIRTVVDYLINIKNVPCKLENTVNLNIFFFEIYI